MVKRIISISISLLIAFAFSGTIVMANSSYDIELENNNTTVQNSLPNVRIYCETTDDYETDNLSVEIDKYPAEVTDAKAFKEYNEGVNYYVLVDVSGSVEEEDFNTIKESIIDFGQNRLSGDDGVFLVPFGEKVYLEEVPTCYNPGSDEFADAVRALKAEDDYTNLYDAIDRVAGAIDSELKDELKRSVVLIFTDGMDDTTGGFKNAEEAPEALKVQGTPLYAFVINGSKKSKDSLGELSRSLNGRLYTGNISNNLDALKNSIDNTLTIDTEANNAADIGAKFDVVVKIDGVEKSIEKTVIANKNGELKNSMKYTATKLFHAYWWIIAIVAIAIIALIVLLRIKRHKGIVKVDGETVFRDNITQKQHIKVNKKNVLMLKMRISVDGSETITRDVELINSLIVGRSNICDVFFDDPTMARQNFCIEYHEGRLFIQDLESTNGTILNGIRITSVQELHQVDTIVAGKSKIIVNW